MSWKPRVGRTLHFFSCLVSSRLVLFLKERQWGRECMRFAGNILRKNVMSLRQVVRVGLWVKNSSTMSRYFLPSLITRREVFKEWEMTDPTLRYVRTCGYVLDGGGQVGSDLDCGMWPVWFFGCVGAFGSKAWMFIFPYSTSDDWIEKHLALKATF